MQFPSLARRGVIFGVILLVLWVVVGTLGFVLIEKWSVLDALYMTVITISTVGFREVLPLSSGGKIFTSLLIVAGLATAIYTFTSLGQLLLEGELLRFVERRRMKSGFGKLKDHYIVCGFGRVGKTVVEGLQRRALPFCVIERDPSCEENLRGKNLLYAIADATSESDLLDAGVRQARAVLCLLPSDADNLYLTLTAKYLNPNVAVIARASDEKAEVKLTRGGADHVVSPYRIAGLRMLHAAVNPTLVEFMELVTHRQHIQLSLGEVRVCPGSEIAGKSLAEAGIRKRYGVIVIAIKRETGEMLFNPDPADKIQPDDLLVALGKDSDLESLESACGF